MDCEVHGLKAEDVAEWLGVSSATGDADGQTVRRFVFREWGGGAICGRAIPQAGRGGRFASVRNDIGGILVVSYEQDQEYGLC